MAYIVVGIVIWMIVGVLVAFLLGKAMKIANLHEGHNRFTQVHSGHTATRV